MNLALAIAGLMVLIVIHEAGHMLAAKAVGMKVDRFALFFPPLILRRKIGETEYAIGAIPLGGYVRIAGQSPTDELPPEDEHRSYAKQPIWKRAVVIAAGPAANLLVCLLLLMALFTLAGVAKLSPSVDGSAMRAPALGVLKPGDRVISVDGRRGGPREFVAATRTHRCSGPQVDGCEAAQPATIVVERDGQVRVFKLKPRYDAANGFARLGFSFGQAIERKGPLDSLGLGLSSMWAVTKATADALGGVADPVKRKELGGVVGGVAVTEQAFSVGLASALELLAFISLSLALINLLPILPLDGGHLFWLLVEKVRGRPPTLQTLERATVVGFALVGVLFVIGLTNDLGRLTHDGFRLGR